MKRNLQWTMIALACGVLAAAFVTARPAQGDTVASNEIASQFVPVNVRIEDLFPRGR